jgi:hypothetical protein
MAYCHPVMRIIVFILTALIQLVAAVTGFLILLLAMNGYSENQAMPGLVLYLILALGSVLGLSLASTFLVKRLVERRAIGGFAASIASVLGFSILGGLILIVSFFGAIALAEVMREMK